MRKTISAILFVVMLASVLNLQVVYGETNDLVISKPVISTGMTNEVTDKPTVGLNSVSTYIYNASEENVSIEFAAIINDNMYSSVEAEIASGESRRFDLGFYINSIHDVTEFTVRNIKTNQVYTNFENIPINEAFGISYTNAHDGLIIDNDVIFEFNSIVENVGDIHVTDNVTAVEFKTDLSVCDGKTTLRIIPDTVLTAGKVINVELPEIADIFGRVIQSRNFIFTVSNVENEYSVYQKTKVTNQAGIGGFAILADFENNTPGKVYFARETVVPEGSYDYNLPFKSSSVATVIDPEGKLAAIYDFSDMQSGKKNIVLEIPYRMEGIWQFKFTSSRQGDVLEIALPQAKNWGVRGETLLGITDTTPKTSYIYVPQKVNDLYVATTSSSVSANIYNTDNELQVTTSKANGSFAKNEGTLSNIEGESIYKLEIPDSYRGGIMIDYAPSLMCPTIEMAQNLKGGWTDVQGVLVQGSMQKAARELLLEYISEKNFDIVYNAPEYVRGKLKNPYAESYLFGAGPLTNVNSYAKKQNFNISSPYCGSFVSDDTATWEDGTFHNTANIAFADLINMDGELNVLYHNEALINRMAVSVLATMVSLSEDVMIKDNNESGNAPLTHGNFYFSYAAYAYNEIRDFLDEKTRNVMDDIMVQLAVKQGDMPGRGPTNQWFFTLKGLSASAYSTSNDVVKKMLNRQFEGLINGPVNNKGQSAAGYFIEQGGCDGSNYNDLGSSLFYDVYKMVKTNDYNNKYLPALENIVEKNLEFNSLFFVSNNNGGFRTNAATSRTLTYLGAGSGHMTYTKIMDEFPLAKRRFELFDRFKTEKLAYDNIDKYINCGIDFDARSKYSSIFEFEAYKNVVNAQSEKLPFEYESGIWDKPGVIAVKHKDLYMNVFYTVPESNTLPGMSFMGGGMSVLWGDGVETVSASVKHKDYSDITSYDQILASCVFGKKSDDTVFVTGKEKAVLEWLEADKKFKISGKTPDNIDVSWTYTLNDKGITQAVEASGDTSEMWLNIPISNVCKDAVVSHEPGKLKYSVDNQFVVFEWDKNSEYYVTELEGIRYLRINMSDGTETVNIEHNTKPASGDITIEDTVFSENEDTCVIKLKNNVNKLRNVTCIVAEYAEQRLVDCNFKTLEIMGNTEESVAINKQKATNGNVVKVMAWESLDSLFPYDFSIK